MMRRYVKGNSFREIKLDGAVLITRTEAQPESRQTFEGPVRARWEYDRHIECAIADDYQLVQNSAAGAEEEHGSLIEAIQTTPDAVEPYLVYGDWLQRRAEPRGELIAVQHALQLATDPERSRLQRAEAALIMLNRERLFGPILSRVRNIDEQSFVIDLFDLTWYLGFIRCAALTRWRLRGVVDQPHELWAALLATDSANVLREIYVDWTDCDQLATARISQTLSVLQISVERWWPLQRDDEEHRVDQGYGTLEDIFGPPADSAPAVLSHLETLLRLPFGGLERLVLSRCPFARQLIAWLFDSPILRSIRQLDLSGGSLDDADIPLLEARHRSFSHLERLDLQRNRFSKLGRERLATLGSFVAIE